MNRNYEIVDGIYLVQGSHKLDMHNNFDFKNLDYSVAERKLVLNWARSEGDWVSSSTPAAVTIEFTEVGEFGLCRAIQRCRSQKMIALTRLATGLMKIGPKVSLW
jgi:hypothetical protein